MRSSTLSTSKSGTSKFQLKELIVCPIKQKANKITVCNKKKKENSLQGFTLLAEQISIMPFITFNKNQQYLTHQQALSFLYASSNNTQIQLTGFYGGDDVSNGFFQGISQLAHKQLSNIDLKEGQQGIYLYNFCFKKKNAVHYFIKLISNRLSQNQQIASIFSMLAGQFVFFIGQKQKEQGIQQMLQRVNEGLKVQTCNLTFPKQCHLIYKDKIEIHQNTLKIYQHLFQSLTLSAIKSSSFSLTGSKVNNQSNQQKISLILKSLIRNQSNKSNLICAKHIPIIVQYASKFIKFPQGNKEVDGQYLFKSIYGNKITQIMNKYQQFFHQLDYGSIDCQQQLIDTLGKKEQQGLRSFDQQKVQTCFHLLYKEQLCINIQEFQRKIIENYNLHRQQSQDNHYVDDDDEQQKEIDSSHSLLSAIETLKDKYESSSLPRDYAIQKVLILARNAARLNILGYDQKVKVAQLREQIDKKWEQYNMALQQKEKAQQLPTEANLSREKYNMMQQKISVCNTKASFIKQQIKLVKSNGEIESRQYKLKQAEYSQLLKSNEKQADLLRFIKSSSVQNPRINELHLLIEAANNKKKQFSLKKQLILQSINAQPPIQF